MTDNSSPAVAAPRMAGHTPGPWRVIEGRTLLHIGGEGPVCSISVSANHVHEDEPGTKRRYIERQRANARLVSASPDLLEVLKEVVEALRIHAPGTSLNNHNFDALGIKAHAAIDKAEHGSTQAAVRAMARDSTKAGGGNTMTEQTKAPSPADAKEDAEWLIDCFAKTKVESSSQAGRSITVATAYLSELSRRERMEEARQV